MSSLAYLPNRLVRYQQQPFSLLEARVFLLACSCLHRYDRTLTPIRIKLTDLVVSTGGNTYRLLREACRSLLQRTFDGEHLFASLDIAEQAGCIEGTFNPLLERELLTGSGYTTVTLPASHFTNAHSYRLLWLLSSYKSLPHHRFSLEQLRTMMCGKQHVYKEFSDFKRYVLKPALKELNTSGYQVVLQEVKRGRKVTSIHFTTQFPVPTKRKLSAFAKEKLLAQVAAEPVAVAPDAANQLTPDQFTDEQLRLVERLTNDNNKMDLHHAQLIVKAVGRDSNEIEAANSEIYKIVQLGIIMQGKRVKKLGEYLFISLVKNLNLQLGG